MTERIRANKRRIRELAALGECAPAIGRIVGLAPHTVKYHAKMMGVPLAKGRPGSRPRFQRGSLA
jgi:hypothetical protein